MTDTRSSSGTSGLRQRFEAAARAVSNGRNGDLRRFYEGAPESDLQAAYEALLGHAQRPMDLHGAASFVDELIGEDCNDSVRALVRKTILSAAQTQPAPCKQAYEVARHIIGYLEGNCGLSFFDLKQADWDAVTKLVATLALPSTDQLRLSEEERHAIEHARYQVGQASIVNPDCCFDYDLVKDLLRAMDRAYPMSSTKSGGAAK